MAGWDGASLSDVLAPQPAAVRQHRALDSPGQQFGWEPRAAHSPRTAAALGLWQAPGPRNRAQAAHEELWGGDLGALLASSAANPRAHPRARPAYAAREQTSTGVMAALNEESAQRVRDRQRRLRPASAQRLVDRHGHAEDGHGSGRAGGGAAAGRSGGGGGGGGGEGSAGGSAAVRAGDGQAHLGDMQLSPVRTDALPSAQAWQGPRLSAASVRASKLRGAHSQKCSL
jgi:hypothetical protein